MIARLVGFAGTAYLARVLGPEGFGILGFALAFTGYIALAVDGGFNAVGAREVARRPADAASLAASIVVVRLLLAMAALLGLAIIAYLLPKPGLVSAATWALLSMKHEPEGNGRALWEEVEQQATPEQLSAWTTASQYHLLHSVVLLGLALYARVSERSVDLQGALLLAGIVLFSGSIYLLVLTEQRWLGCQGRRCIGAYSAGNFENA